MKYIYRKSFESLKSRVDEVYNFMIGETIMIGISFFGGIVAYSFKQYFLTGLASVVLILAWMSIIDSSNEFAKGKDRIAKEYPKRAEEVLNIE